MLKQKEKNIMDKQNRFFTNGITVCLLAVICCILWGSAITSIKIGYKLFEIAAGDSESQILFAGCRFFIAGIMTVLMGSIAQRSILKPRKHSFVYIIKLCLFQTILQYLFFYIGLAHTSGVKSSIINGSGVFITILISCLIFRQETLTARKIAGCILGFAGVVIVNLNGTALSMDMSFNGEGFILLSIVASAISSSLIKDFSRYDNPVMLSGYQFIFGGAVLIACGFLSGGRIFHITRQGVAVLLYLAFVSAAAYSLWSVLLKYNPVSKVAIWGFTNPIFSVILSIIFLNEGQQSSVLRIITALFLVCVGIYIVNSTGLHTRLKPGKTIKIKSRP